MFKLTLVTPGKKLVYDQEIEEVTIPGFRGELNILPGHSPLITTLETGVMKWKIKDQDIQNKAVVSWGYCHINPSGVNILADIVDSLDEIIPAEKEALIVELEKKIMSDTVTIEERADFQRSIARAQAALEIKPK
jgi:F-type H+-transporting ATPase subunit epsilon